MAGAAGLVASAAMASAGLLSWRRGDPTRVVVAVLERRVGHLKVDRASFQRYADEYVDFQRDYRRHLAALGLLAFPLRYASPYRFLELGHPLRRLEDNVVSTYLLSTDFFQQGADESRPVRYLGFYDPLRSGCRNPFARSAAEGPG